MLIIGIQPPSIPPSPPAQHNHRLRGVHLLRRSSLGLVHGTPTKYSEYGSPTSCPVPYLSLDGPRVHHSSCSGVYVYTGVRGETLHGVAVLAGSCIGFYIPCE